VTINSQGKITDVNQTTVYVTGRTRDELIGSDFCDYFTEPDSARVVYEQVFSTGRFNNYPLSIRDTTGNIIDVLYNATVYRNELGEVEGVFAAARDVTERKYAQQLEQHRQQILQMLADKLPLAQILNTIACNVEALNPDMLCSILLLDSEGKHLKHGAAPSLAEFCNQAVDGLAIGPAVGSCGTACFTGKRVIVEDINTHPYWVPYLDIANRAELASCWSQPILSAQGKVLGSFAIYHRHIRQPKPADLVLIEEESLLTALVIEKASDLSKLQLAAQVFTHAREGIFITDSRKISV
jgi:PAS domain S-box-containing protein